MAERNNFRASPANQKLVVYVLGTRGHEVVVAQDGHEALERARTERFDVVLMDVQMPVMDGLQATAAIRALNDPAMAGVPIVAMTAHALKGDRERCLAAGMDSYIAKPIDGYELIRLVEHFGAERRETASDQLVPAPARGAPLDHRAELSTPVVFDHDEAVKRCYGQEHMFREMVRSLFDEAEPLLVQMHAALDRGDGAELAAAAHRLKNTVVYLAAQPATEAAQRLVDLGRAGELTDAASALGELEGRLARLTATLAHYARSEGPR